MDHAGDGSTGEDRRQGLIAVAVMAAIMWLVEAIDQISGADLDRYGIEPRQTDGLAGILTAPFLHSGFGHLIANTVPFLVLGAVIALSGLVRMLAATAIIALIAGIGAWLTGPERTNHIGASGIVVGYATYLIVRGILSRSLLHLTVGVVVLALYGPTVLSSFVPTDGISWQSHLFGGIGGVVAAFVLDRRRAGGSA